MPDSEKRESRGFAEVRPWGNGFGVVLDNGFCVAICDRDLEAAYVSKTLNSAAEKYRQEAIDQLQKVFDIQFEEGVAKARREALEEASSANCQWCEMGWIVETFEHGSFHRVPPENAPTTFLNKKCDAHEIRRLIEGK